MDIVKDYLKGKAKCKFCTYCDDPSDLVIFEGGYAHLSCIANKDKMEAVKIKLKKKIHG